MIGTRFQGLKKKQSVLLSLAVLCVLGLAGCQKSPEEDIVVNKNEGSLEQAITQQNKGNNQKDMPDSYTDSFTTDTDNLKVTVEAEVSPAKTELPVVRVKPREITAEEAKHWAEVLFEGNTAYEPTSILTKAQIEENILSYKQMVADKDALISEYGSEADAQAAIDYYNQLIESYEKDYKTAPEVYDRKECDWKFHPYDYYMSDATAWEGNDEFESLKNTYRLSAVTEELNDHEAIVDATNRNEKDYLTHMLWFYYTDEETMNDIEYKQVSKEEAADLAGEIIEKLGLKEWSLWSVEDASTESESAYRLIYTPVYQDVMTIMGPEIDLKSEELYAANYYYEQLEVRIINGIVRNVELTSPTDVVKVENESVKTILFEKAYGSFKNQVKAQYSKSLFVDEEDPLYDDAEIEIQIKSIMQGLFRVKNKDSGEDFLMVPAWTFEGRLIRQGEDWGPVNAIVVNAIDGSIINTNLGY